jgi:hypothetical protein
MDEINKIFVVLSYGAESCVFREATQKVKDYSIQKYKFACCFVWVFNFVAHIEGST